MSLVSSELEDEMRNIRVCARKEQKWNWQLDIKRGTDVELRRLTQSLWSLTVSYIKLSRSPFELHTTIIFTGLKVHLYYSQL